MSVERYVYHVTVRLVYLQVQILSLGWSAGAGLGLQETSQQTAFFSFRGSSVGHNQLVK